MPTVEIELKDKKKSTSYDWAEPSSAKNGAQLQSLVSIWHFTHRWGEPSGVGKCQLAHVNVGFN